MLSCLDRRAQAANRESRRRHGITQEAVWIQTTPAGDIAVVLIESPDIAAALLGLANSANDFDVWFRAHLADRHGIDLAAGMAAPEQVLDFPLVGKARFRGDQRGLARSLLRGGGSLVRE